MELKKMYPGIANSPTTFLKENISAEDTIIKVVNTHVFGGSSTLAVIGIDEDAETVLINEFGEGFISVVRAIEGKAKAWEKDTPIARNFTNYDYTQLITNIKLVNTNVDTKADKSELNTKIDKTVVDKLKNEIELKLNNKIENLRIQKEKVNNDRNVIVQLLFDTEKEKNVKVDLYKAILDGNPETLPKEKADTLVTVGLMGEILLEAISELLANSIVDNLTSSETDKPLSANQGRILREANINLKRRMVLKEEIVDNLTSDEIDKPLSANQGKVLFQYASNGKTKISEAITGKGVNADKSDTFGTLADKIKDIKTGYGIGDIIKSENLKKIGKWTIDNTTQFKDYTSDVESVAVDNQGNVYVGVGDSTVRKISPNGDEIWQFTGHKAKVYAITIDKDGYVYTGSADDTAIKISPTGEEVWKFYGHSSSVYTIAVDKDGYVYTGAWDSTVRKISPNGDEIWQFTMDKKLVSSVIVDKDGYVYAAVSGGSFKKISPSGKEIWTFKNPYNSTLSLAIDSKGFVYAATDSQIRKVDTNGNQVWQFNKFNSAVNGLAIDSRDYIYAGSHDGIIKKIYSDSTEIWEHTAENEISSLVVDKGYNVYFYFSYSTKIFKLKQKGTIVAYKVLNLGGI